MLTSRIIPALAGNTGITHGRLHVSSDHPRSRGNTGWWRYASTVRGDHPRSRGEYNLQWNHQGMTPGSSPLSRGIHEPLRASCRTHRIIPALAGNTITQARVLRVTQDHPRSRGEYGGVVMGMSSAEGSSPLSRGIRCRRLPAWTRGRIIPALAGNTLREARQKGFQEDHPRSRGEYCWIPACCIAVRGSSPLSRGIQDKSRIWV